MERSLSWSPTSHAHDIALFLHSLARSTLSKTLLELTSGYFSTVTSRSMRESRTAAWVADHNGARAASRLSVIIPALVGARTGHSSLQRHTPCCTHGTESLFCAERSHPHWEGRWQVCF